MTAMTLFEGKQLDLVRRTVAKDCDAAEFEQFIHICRAVRLDPLRRQIYCFVFNKDNPRYRQMTVVTAIGGYRAIAERTGSYRGDDRAPRYDMGEKSPTNPLGISRCEVTVYKYVHGAWFPVVGEAWWDEYVPIREGIIDPKKTGWTKMPRIMIAKCAEANALRKAWPDDFEGVSVEEELDQRASLELTATELADAAVTEHRLSLVGGANALTVDWCDGEPLQRVQVGTFGDAVLKYITENPEKSAFFQERNRDTLKEYWARDKSGALELKKAFETAKSSEAAE